MFNVTKFIDAVLFLEWLEKNGEKTFDYMSNEQCCFAQWATACGAVEVNMGGVAYFADKERHTLPYDYVLAMDRVINKDRIASSNSDATFTFAEVAAALSHYVRCS